MDFTIRIISNYYITRYLGDILWLFLEKIIFTVDISDDIGGDFALDSENRFLFLILILFLFHLSTKDME